MKQMVPVVYRYYVFSIHFVYGETHSLTVGVAADNLEEVEFPAEVVGSRVAEIWL